MSPSATNAPTPATGEQFVITCGEHRAVAVEFGGGLREYTYGGEHVLDGYAEQEMCASGRGQLLVPWPNRVRDGRYEWDGETMQLALSEPAKHNAIHGLGRRGLWRPSEQEERRLVLEHVVYPREGYPFTVGLSVEYTLGDDGLTVRTTARNLGDRPCPYGAGHHPYLTVGTDTIDECLLTAPGRTWMPTDDQAIPVGRRAVEDTEYDFRWARAIGDTRIDTPYTDLERDADGLARVSLAAPGGKRAVTLWCDPAYEYLMLFTGDTIGAPERRRRGLAVEPMTCAPNAYVSGDGLLRLEPGESATGTWGITPSTG